MIVLMIKIYILNFYSLLINILPLQIKFRKLSTIQVPLYSTLYVVDIRCITSVYTKNPAILFACNYYTYFKKLKRSKKYDIYPYICYFCCFLHFWSFRCPSGVISLLSEQLFSFFFFLSTYIGNKFSYFPFIWECLHSWKIFNRI